MLSILAVALIGFLVFKSSLRQGKFVTVSVNGEEKYCYSLSKDWEFTVNTGEKGENINTVVIKDGCVYMKAANCPDKICVSHRQISNVGETIVCLPHKVVVSVEDD